MTTVLVLGGNGFVGRHAVAALQANGANIIIGSRFEHEASTHPQHAIRLEKLQTADQWQPVIADANCVLNCVGILRQRGQQTYRRVHELAPAALAAACAIDNKRFVHVSALGLSGVATSRFLTSKLKGEQHIKSSDADWVIARPSLLDGEGGYGAWWLRSVARLPVFAVPANARGKIAALDVGELGEALAHLCLKPSGELQLDRSREFDLGGDIALSFRDYIHSLRRVHTQRRALAIPIPALLARAFAHLCDLFHATPFSFGHYELLQRDNVPRHNRLAELLRRAPRRIGG